MEFPFRKLPNRQQIRQAADFIPGADVNKIEALVVCFRKVIDVYQALEANLERFGLTFARLGILSLLLGNPKGGMTPSELAEQGGITRATVTGLLDGLEKEGLVERIKHPEDRRMLHVHLTARGRELVAASLPAHFERAAAIVGHLTPAELQQLTALMEKIDP